MALIGRLLGLITSQKLRQAPTTRFSVEIPTPQLRQTSQKPKSAIYYALEAVILAISGFDYPTINIASLEHVAERHPDNVFCTGIRENGTSQTLKNCPEFKAGQSSARAPSTFMKDIMAIPNLPYVTPKHNALQHAVMQNKESEACPLSQKAPPDSYGLSLADQPTQTTTSPGQTIEVEKITQAHLYRCIDRCSALSDRRTPRARALISSF